MNIFNVGLKKFTLLLFLCFNTAAMLSCHNDNEPEGRFVFYRLDDHLYVYDVKNNSEVLIDSEIPGYNHFFSRSHLSPNKKRFAYEAKRDSEVTEDIFVKSIDGTTVLKITNPVGIESRILGVTWSPKSNKLAYGIVYDSFTESAVYVVDINSGENIKASFDYSPSKNFGDLQWSPNNRYLSMAVYDSSNRAGLDVFDTQHLSTVRLDSGLTTHLFGGIKWSPNSQQLIYISDQNEADQYELIASKPDASERLILEDHFDGVHYIESYYWSESSAQIAYAKRPEGPGYCVVSRDIYTIDSNGLSNLKIDNPNPLELDVCDYRWVPNENVIFFQAANDDGALDLYRVNADGSGQTKINDRNANDNVGTFKFSPDGKKLAYLSQEAGSVFTNLFVSDMDGENAIDVSTELGDTAQVIDCFWSPDSRQLAYVVRNLSGQNDLYVVDTDGNSNVSIAENVKPSNFEVYWSPNSEYIVFRLNEPGGLVMTSRYGSELTVPLNAFMVGWVD